jgi:hypothetical protein
VDRQVDDRSPPLHPPTGDGRTEFNGLDGPRHRGKLPGATAGHRSRLGGVIAAGNRFDRRDHRVIDQTFTDFRGDIDRRSATRIGLPRRRPRRTTLRATNLRRNVR